jgi:hypothetical protein
MANWSKGDIFLIIDLLVNIQHTMLQPIAVSIIRSTCIKWL